MLEKAARAAADANGDDYDAIPADKGEWIDARGTFGGHFRDVNMPMKIDYDDIARAVLAAIRDIDNEALEAMYSAMYEGPFDATSLPMLGAGFEAAIDAILEGETK
jgi:hypothetical protein